MNSPSPTATDGTLVNRDEHGRFIQGNKAAKGNPYAKRVAQLRSAMMDAVTAGDVRAVIARMIELAKGGDVAAAKLVLEHACGRPLQEGRDDSRLMGPHFTFVLPAPGEIPEPKQVVNQAFTARNAGFGSR